MVRYLVDYFRDAFTIFYLHSFVLGWVFSPCFRATRMLNWIAQLNQHN